MNGQDGVQKVQVANALLRLRARQADVLRFAPSGASLLRIIRNSRSDRP